MTTWAGLTVHISKTLLTLGDYEKKFLNNDGQQLHKYQQTKQPTTSHLNNGHVVCQLKCHTDLGDTAFYEKKFKK